MEKNIAKYSLNTELKGWECSIETLLMTVQINTDFVNHLVPSTTEPSTSLVRIGTDACESIVNSILLKDLSKTMISIKMRGHGSLVVKVLDRGWRVMSSSRVPLKTRRVGERFTLNLLRAQTSSHWCGEVVRRGRVPTQVMSSSLDHGSKLLAKFVAKSPRVPEQCAVNIHSPIKCSQSFQKLFVDNPFGHGCSICDRLWFRDDLRTPVA
ncbi:uncharacterized protein TNCV_1605191 [Trichonephila clavipes]|nr:uncharacterized protein TNCV_1605191 [Trichonephila clavipes]